MPGVGRRSQPGDIFLEMGIAEEKRPQRVLAASQQEQQGGLQCQKRTSTRRSDLGGNPQGIQTVQIGRGARLDLLVLFPLGRPIVAAIRTAPS